MIERLFERTPQWMIHAVALASVALGTLLLVAIEATAMLRSDYRYLLGDASAILTFLLAISFALSLYAARAAGLHRLEAEDALKKLSRASMERLRAERAVDTFFMVSATPMCVLGFDGYARRLNHAWEELLGYTVPTLSAKPLIEFVHPDDRAATTGMLTDLKQGAKVMGFENRMITAAGEIRWLSWSATIIPSEEVVVANLKDMTDCKVREQMIETRTANLERSNADLERFAFMASHDLQEPLRMVASFGQQLEKHYKGQLDARADRYIHYVVDGALRMQSLISSLLSYSRLEQTKLTFETIDSAEAVRTGLRNLAAALQESQAIVTVGSLPEVQADPGMLAHLFQNLIANSIKFRRDGPPRITISVSRSEGEFVFLVEDEGIGIKPEDAERVFGLFQRLHSKAEYPGSGMGLAICQKIVQRHGGRIWVESEPGKGSRFYFAIPCRMTEMKGGPEHA